MLSLLNPYLWAVKLRNFLYQKRVFKTCRPKSRVISVGNLSVGGTGKTPTVMEIAKFLTSDGLKVSILLRGYKRKSKGTLIVADYYHLLADVERAGDEAYLYAKFLKKVPVVVSEDRCQGAQIIEKHFQPDVILLDDAFQHLRIQRDLDIVLLTPKDLKEKLLPFGRLREPLEVLKNRGHYCLFSKTSKPNKELENFCQRLGKPFGYLQVVGYRLLTPSLEERDFSTLKGLKVGIVSAVGDNRLFEQQMEKLASKYGFLIVERKFFPDHFDYRCVSLNPNLLWITTPKDLFKLEGKVKNLLAVDRIFQLPENLKRQLKELF